MNIVPPYVSYRTFRNFLELLGEGMPGRIDRSVWGPRYSGTSGQQLMTALKSLSLISDEGIPSKALEEITTKSGTERRGLLISLLHNKYKNVFTIDLKRATKSQFNEAFKEFGVKDGVMVKCQSFFIQACQDAGIELSSYILARRHNIGSIKKPENRTINKTTSVSLEENSKQKLNSSELMMSKILDKYPDFDPTWDSEVQKAWMDGMMKLYEGLKIEEKKRGGHLEPPLK